MNNFVNITDDIYWIGVNDRETELFESLWPLPDGVSYNSYLIDDEQVALFDTVKNSYLDSYLRNLKNHLGDREVDYLIINHMEPDHSGAIKAIRDAYPNITIVGNKKTMSFLEAFYSITDNLKVVSNGDVLDLGEHQIKFFMTPMVHWPETMMSFELKEGVIFSGDAFGGFGTLDGGIFDDEVNIDFYEEETRRYFSNIVGKYGPMVNRAIKSLSDLEINVVAPTHGPVWRERPEEIIKKYQKWSNQETEQGVVIVYASMYGNTESLVDSIARELANQGIKDIRVYNVAKTHVSHIINDIWKYEGLILGSCTYNMRIFPPMESLLGFLENKNIKNHTLGIFGTYTWSGGALARLKDFINQGKNQCIEPIIEVQSAPSEKDFNDCKELAINLAKQLRKED